MALLTGTGYTVGDLDRLRDELGIAHLELDPWGSLIVSPASREHDRAMALLHEQAIRQMGLPAGHVWSNSFAWKVPGGSGYTNVPDLAVLAPGWQEVGDWHVAPPPLLVVEVASPSTRHVDRGRKLADYRLGGAGVYLLVDLADQPGVTEVRFEAHLFASGDVIVAAGSIDLVVDGRPVRFDLATPPGA